MITVAIPLFNKAAYIADTLKSALSQSFSDFEIIVVDDGSTDDSVSILRQFKDAHLAVIRQHNAGPAAARNRAIQEAHGSFVAFLDADDIWLPDHLLHLNTLNKRYPQAALLGNSFVESSAGDISNRAATPVRYRVIDDFFSECAFDQVPFFTSSCMVSRKHAIELGGFPIGNFSGEDIALWVRIAASAPVAVSNYVGCYYRRNAGSLTFQPSFRLLHPVCLSAIDDILAQHGAWSLDRKHGAREYYNRLALAQCLDCLQAGDLDAATKFLALSVGTRAHRRRWWQAKILTLAPRPLRNLIFQAQRQIHA